MASAARDASPTSPAPGDFDEDYVKKLRKCVSRIVLKESTNEGMTSEEIFEKVAKLDAFTELPAMEERAQLMDALMYAD